MEIILGIIAGVLILPTAGFLYEAFFSARERRQFVAHPPAERIDIGGRKLHYWLEGKQHDAPTVILEAGAGSNSLDWSVAQPKISEYARTLAYDRAGLGWSDPADDGRKPENIVSDLKALLNALGEKPPYVLVGHSFGGLYVRKYAETYPDEVAALVLVDSSHPQMLKDEDRQGEITRLKRVQQFKRFGMLRLLIKRILTRLEELPEAERKRYVAMTMHDTSESLTEVAPVLRDGVELTDDLGDLPLVVVCRSVTEEASSSRRWHEYQKDLLDLSTNTRFFVGERGSHFVQMTESDLVAQAVLAALAKAGFRDAGDEPVAALDVNDDAEAIEVDEMGESDEPDDS